MFQDYTDRLKGKVRIDVSGQLHAPAALLAGKEPLIPI